MDSQQIADFFQLAKIFKPLFEDKTNEWLPVISAIGGAAVGAFATIVPSYFLEKIKLRNERKLTTSALISEISAFLVIIEHRKYVHVLNDIIDDLKQSGGTHTLSVKTHDNYARIYQSHVGRIGVLDLKVARKVIEFHQLIDAVIQDVSDGGILCDKGGGLAQFEELKQIIDRAIFIGHELVSKKKIGF